jgi:hypothetical protein
MRGKVESLNVAACGAICIYLSYRKSNQKGGAFRPPFAFISERKFITTGQTSGCMLIHIKNHLKLVG